MRAEGCYLANIRVGQRILERKLERALAELDRRMKKTMSAERRLALSEERKSALYQLRGLRSSMRQAKEQTRRILRGRRKKSKPVC